MWLARSFPICLVVKIVCVEICIQARISRICGLTKAKQGYNQLPAHPHIVQTKTYNIAKEKNILWRLEDSQQCVYWTVFSSGKFLSKLAWSRGKLRTLDFCESQTPLAMVFWLVLAIRMRKHPHITCGTSACIGKEKPKNAYRSRYLPQIHAHEKKTSAWPTLNTSTYSLNSLSTPKS